MGPQGPQGPVRQGPACISLLCLQPLIIYSLLTYFFPFKRRVISPESNRDVFELLIWGFQCTLEKRAGK